MKGWRAALGATILGIVSWQVIVLATGVPRFILPSPMEVIQSIWTHRVLLATHGVTTITEILVGLLLGTILGASTAIYLASAPTARALIKPILVFSQAVPVFALAPILTLWLGYGLWSKIAMALLIIYFPVTSAFFDGLMRTNENWLGMAKVMGATPSRVMWRIRIPAALPNFASGLRLAAVYAPIGAIIGEWVGASKGLGYLMLLANGRAKTDLMFAALIVLAVFTVIFHAAIDRACRRFLEKSATA